MKVDLASLRALVEEELGRVEQKRTQLQQELQHISAVEEIAREAAIGLRSVEESEAPDPSERELSEQSRKWFQQV